MMTSEMKIELIDRMGDDLRVANVARVSFDKWKEEFDQKDARLIDYLAAHEHTSPFRHVTVSLRCYAPLFLARQLGKHQIGLSWNEVSRRYVDTEIELYEPKEWRLRPEDGIKQGSSQKIAHPSQLYGFEPTIGVDLDYENVMAICLALYELYIANGVAPEMARMVLPQSMMVSWVWTGSVQAFYHVWRLRSGEGAQVEAKEFATLLDNVIEPLFPACWQALKAAA